MIGIRVRSRAHCSEFCAQVVDAGGHTRRLRRSGDRARACVGLRGISQEAVHGLAAECALYVCVCIHETVRDINEACRSLGKAIR